MRAARPAQAVPQRNSARDVPSEPLAAPTLTVLPPQDIASPSLPTRELNGSALPDAKWESPPDDFSTILHGFETAAEGPVVAGNTVGNALGNIVGNKVAVPSPGQTAPQSPAILPWDRWTERAIPKTQESAASQTTTMALTTDLKGSSPGVVAEPRKPGPLAAEPHASAPGVKVEADLPSSAPLGLGKPQTAVHRVTAPFEPVVSKPDSAAVLARGPEGKTWLPGADTPERPQPGAPPLASSPAAGPPELPPVATDPPASTLATGLPDLGLGNLPNADPSGPPLPEFAFAAKLVARFGAEGDDEPDLPEGRASQPALSIASATSVAAILPGASETPRSSTGNARNQTGFDRADSLSGHSAPHETAAADVATQLVDPRQEDPIQEDPIQQDPAKVDMADANAARDGRPAGRPEHIELTVGPPAAPAGPPLPITYPAPASSHATQPSTARSDPAASPADAADARAQWTLPAPPETPGTGPARDISVRLSGADQTSVEVRLSDRGGELHVAVRSADPQTAESLRAHLPELVERLGSRGFETEIWRPQQASASDRGGPHSQSGSRDAGRDPQQQRGGRGGQESPEESGPEWMDELAASFRPPRNK